MGRTWYKRLPAAELLIQGGRVVDPESGVDAVQDVLISKGKVTAVGKGLKPGKTTRVVEYADDQVVAAAAGALLALAVLAAFGHPLRAALEFEQGVDA